MRKKSFSIIIRCFNEEEHIGRLLSGILEQTVQPEEIIIVDSGSTDATLSIASRFPVRILSILKENFSFGRSLNIGCRKARSEILVIASAHVYPIYKNWIELLLAPFQNEHVGLVYGKQRAEDVSRFSEQRVFQKWFPDFSVNEQKHPFCNNANVAVRKDLWEKFNYDEELTGLEDLDFAKKITQAGYNISYQSQAVIVHIHNQSYRQIFGRYYREAVALKKIYPAEKFGRREFIRLLLTNIFSDIIEATKHPRFMHNLVGVIRFRFMQFWGTYRGFNDGFIKSSVIKGRFYYPAEKEHSVEGITNIEEQEINYSEILRKPKD